MLFYIPKNPDKRVKWLKAVGLNIPDLAPKIHRYCCEDHFDLPNDAENWVEYSIRKCKIRLKNDVLPHICDCPPNRTKPTSTTVEHARKLQRLEFVDENEITSSSILKKNIKTCAVPICKNSTLSTPNKILFCIPKNPDKREKWLKAIGLNVTDFAPNVHRYCCEDHFDLPNDAENWIEYTIRKCRIRLKSDVVPKIYDCPPNRTKATTTTVFEYATKLQRPEFVDVNAITSSSTVNWTENGTQTSSSENGFCKTNIPSTCCEFKASIVPVKPLLVSKSVQVKPRFRSKYVQCTSVPQ
ncbi:hypothetical protein CBL_08327 [Carabus blaptoides fortunei]